MITTPTRHKFTVRSLLLMEEAGVFAANERVELINGDFVTMSSINPPHAICVRKLLRYFQQHLSVTDYILDVQDPVELLDDTLPQPDMVVAHLLGIEMPLDSILPKKSQ